MPSDDKIDIKHKSEFNTINRFNRTRIYTDTTKDLYEFQSRFEKFDRDCEDIKAKINYLHQIKNKIMFIKK